MRSPSIKLPMINQQKCPSELEIVGGFDGLTALDELAPGMEWEDLLAASWGLPVVNKQQDPPKKAPAVKFGAIVRNYFSFGSAY
jgi:hypothetical protein